MDEVTELFDEEDVRTGKMRSLPTRTGQGWPLFPVEGRKLPLQRRLAGKVDPRLGQAKDTLRKAVEKADLEALLWVISAALWWLTLEQGQELGAVLLKLLDGETDESTAVGGVDEGQGQTALVGTEDDQGPDLGGGVEQTPARGDAWE